MYWYKEINIDSQMLTIIVDLHAIRVRPSLVYCRFVSHPRVQQERRWAGGAY